MFRRLILKDRLRVFLRIDPIATELISSVALIFWGVVAALGDWTDLPTYAAMGQLAHQDTWAAIALVVGFIQLVCTLAAAWGYRQFLAATASVFWFVLFGMTAAAVFSTPAPWVYMTIGLANSWAVAQIPRHRGALGWR